MTTPRERLERVNDLGIPEGAYTVELTDRRTGRRERVTAGNYVTPAYERFVRWAQGYGFHLGMQPIDNGDAGDTYGMGPGGSGSTPINWLAPPRVNANGIVATDSTIAEDSGSEWGTGRTIAYGSRWKLTIPAESKRGQINEAQSTLTDDSVRLVWDFVETQGNGTFQSLNMADFDGSGNLPLTPTGYHYRYRNPGDNASLYIDLNISYINDAGTIAYGVAIEPSSGGGVSGDPLALYSVSLTDGTDQGSHYECSAPVKVCTLGNLVYNSSSDAGSLTTVRFGADCSAFYVGGDWLVAWPGDDGEAYLGRWNAAGVQQWAMPVISDADSPVTQPSAIATVVADATKAYVGCGLSTSYRASVHLELHRVDLATQTVDAQVALGDTLNPWALGIDGTNLIVGGYYTGDGFGYGDAGVGSADWPTGVHQITTGGTYVNYYGNPYSLSRNESTVSPWSTSRQAGTTDLVSERLHGFRGYSSYLYDSLWTGGATTTALGDIPNDRVVYGAGKLWKVSDNATGDDSYRRLFAMGGSNIFSRTLLGGAQTKSTAQTMQLTYELTLPSSWRGRPTHVGLPS